MSTEKKATILPSVSFRSLRLCGCIFLTLVGCASPSPVNNKLRAENAKLQEQLDADKHQIETDHATIHALESKVGTLPTLPQDRLDKIFTVSAIKLGKLTGGDNWDPSKPGDTGIKVEVTPIDQQGDKLKAAGTFTIDLFDLSLPSETRIGHWTFNDDQARKDWYSGLMLYSYVFKLPWQQIPKHPDLTLKVTFTDELTGRQFTQQQVIKVNPPTTESASKP